MRGGDILLSDGWTEGAMGRVHSTRHDGGGQPAHWLHIERTLCSAELERVCCCLNEVMRAWGRACVAADRLGACELACSEQAPFSELVAGVNQTQAAPPRSPPRSPPSPSTYLAGYLIPPLHGQETLLSIFPSLGGECEVSTWPHSLCAYLRQAGRARCVRELWESPLEARIFRQVYVPLREVRPAWISPSPALTIVQSPYRPRCMPGSCGCTTGCCAPRCSRSRWDLAGYP